MTDHPDEQKMGPTAPPTPEGTTMHRTSDRTSVLVAACAVALVLAVSPLPTVVGLVAAAGAIGLALVHALTESPVQVVHAEADAAPARR